MTGTPKLISKLTGIFAGVYFTGIFIYLFVNAVVPLTATEGWRGPFDVVAIGFYLLGIIPFVGLFLLDTGMIAKKKDEVSKLKLHAVFVSIFLIVAHVAMIFGMLNPNLLVSKGGM